jgi:hypothetical protein
MPRTHAFNPAAILTEEPDAGIILLLDLIPIGHPDPSGLNVERDDVRRHRGAGLGNVLVFEDGEPRGALTGRQRDGAASATVVVVTV